MTEDPRKVPLNLITQVDRDEIDYQGGISARRHYNPDGSASTGEEDEQTQQPQQQDEQPQQPRRSIFSRIFCCFGSPPQPAEKRPASVQVQPRRDGPPTGGEFLLPPIEAEFHGKPCLVLDLDETLVHSSFKPISNADFIIPVEIDNTVHQVYVLKRPFVDKFMKEMGQLYEVVIFTASLSKYADPVMDLLDVHKVVRWRLFREHCTNHKGNYVKDMARVGRELNQIIIIDNSPASYLFHPENAIPIESWFDDPNDTELNDLIPFLQECAKAKDVLIPLREHFGPT